MACSSCRTRGHRDAVRAEHLVPLGADRRAEVAAGHAAVLERLSTGRWEGDTLVVETTGFNGYTRLDTAGHPHSKQLSSPTRFRRIDARTIEHTVTVHDPKTYTRDWMNVRTWKLKPASDVVHGVFLRREQSRQPVQRRHQALEAAGGDEDEYAHAAAARAAGLLAVLRRRAQAHHSTAAEFDSGKPITFTGTVQKVMWMNPHIYTHIEVKRPMARTSSSITSRAGRRIRCSARAGARTR